LEHSECDETNRRDFDTGWDSVGVFCVRRFVEMVVRKVTSWMQIIAIIEAVSFGIMVAII
jgi:hypothetical protein